MAQVAPDTAWTLVDANPAQIDLVRRKLEVLRTRTPDERSELFNVESDDPGGLNQCGNFESLFRSLRAFLYEHVAPRHQWDRYFRRDGRASLASCFDTPYWPVAFELFFHDAMLTTMFGPAAVQHAPPGSYPTYFRAVFERGLASPSGPDNPFLQHALLGMYVDRPASTLPYLAGDVSLPDPTFLTCEIGSVPDFGRYDFIDCSNLFDWMDEAAVSALAARLGTECQPGTRLLFRQLNNEHDWTSVFGAFSFDADLANTLLAQDRSLFYNRLCVGEITQ